MDQESYKRRWRWLILSDESRVMVDEEDFPRLQQMNWVMRHSKGRGDQVVSMVWDSEKSRIVTRYLAREIIKTGKGYVVNRKDPDVPDYRKSNLIVCTRKEKERMRGKTRKATTSQYKGVSRRKDRKMWSANICVNDHRMYLGLYHREVDAARAYNDAARKYFGEFAYLNDV
ncbi:MAG: hypothetical protein K0B08_11320 [Bacteroidales bacterium]|nr:hypothetical protein [Bacteroidales bacterium]